MKHNFAKKLISLLIAAIMLISVGSISSFAVTTFNLEVAPIAEHNLEFVPGIEPRCTVDGNVDHYKCIDCGKTSEDSEAAVEIDDVILPATDHDWDSMCVSLGASGHAYYCNNPGCSEHTLIEKHIYGEFSKCGECNYPKPKPLTATEKKVYNNLDVTKDGGRGIVKYAKKNNISIDTILVTAKSITTQKSEEVKGSEYCQLLAKTTAVGKTKNTISWSKVKGADGYIVYGSKCSGKFKELKSLENNRISFTHSGLKKGTYYKYVVVAYRFIADANVSISVSKTIHSATTGGNVGNPKAVKVNKTTVALDKGKTFTINASNVKKDKTMKIHRSIGFESTNTTIATVTKNGKITARKKGICYVYAYTQNGVAKKIKVTVK